MAASQTSGFVEVAERCFVARYREWDVSVGALVGEDGVLVIDTRASIRQGHELLDDVRRIAPHVPIRWVVNTHQHFDHVLGNGAMPEAVIHAHAHASTGMAASVDRIQRLIEHSPQADADFPEITAEVLADVLATEVRQPDITFESVATVDVGDRYVELVHLGRGHTDGDVVVRVPDADLVFCGDLVEQSGPPGFGEDSWPLEWAGTLDLVVGLLTDRSTVIPGHGAAVDRQFVQDQRADISTVAELIRSLHAQAVPVEDALSSSTDWPFPAEHLRTAVTRGYGHLAG
ncbi:MAG: MBL fold metallo-hydrolase [Nocardioidaceae bacterium]